RSGRRSRRSDEGRRPLRPRFPSVPRVAGLQPAGGKDRIRQTIKGPPSAKAPTIDPTSCRETKENAMSYAMDQAIAVRAGENARATFIRRTYGHLAGAILAFVALQFVFMTLLQDVSREFIIAIGTKPILWLVVLGAFMGVSWLAEAWARSDVSRG